MLAEAEGALAVSVSVAAAVVGSEVETERGTFWLRQRDSVKASVSLGGALERLLSGRGFFGGCGVGGGLGRDEWGGDREGGGIRTLEVLWRAVTLDDGAEGVDEVLVFADAGDILTAT